MLSALRHAFWSALSALSRSSSRRNALRIAKGAALIAGLSLCADLDEVIEKPLVRAPMLRHADQSPWCPAPTASRDYRVPRMSFGRTVFGSAKASPGTSPISWIAGPIQAHQPFLPLHRMRSSSPLPSCFVSSAVPNRRSSSVATFSPPSGMSRGSDVQELGRGGFLRRLDLDAPQARSIESLSCPAGAGDSCSIPCHRASQLSYPLPHAR